MARKRVHVVFCGNGYLQNSARNLMPMAFLKSLVLLLAVDTEFIRAR